MADPANNNHKNSLNDFDDELDAMLEKVKSSQVSSNDREDEEDAIDRLLLAEDFDSETLYQADDNEDPQIDDIDLSDEADEFGDDLLVEEREEEYAPFIDVIIDDETNSSEEMPDEIEGFFEINDSDEQAFEASGHQAVKSGDQNGYAEALFEDYRDINALFDDFNAPSDRDVLDEPELFGLKSQPDVDKIRVAAQDEVLAGIRPRRSDDDRFESDNADMTASGAFNSDQDPVSLLQQTLKAEFENKIKNVRIYAYIAMGLGGAALIAAIGFGLVAHDAKKEASRLSELVNTLGTTAGENVVQSSDNELDDVKAAIEQLNQRVDDIMLQLSSKAPLSAETDEAQDQLRDLQARLDVMESKTLAMQASKPKAIKAETIKPAVAEISKPVPASAETKKNKLQKGASGKNNTTADWFVNLIAYRQQGYAKSKAVEFGKKGVPVDVVDVKVGSNTWYRLRVGGFRNRDEAASYAAKVKKTLKLSSVWVGNIQG
ncbi:SPOR domain-containing protein [Methylobacter sp. YRD-M1]|uniref:SPOR domain-containing protein n=1 Tax=Methylobacter sp. YRD-M1 TaxID=2911520 RepID=UPI00227B4224|nr:SPOR domain-containing protein [Methylobacter sp. YRD-M1]WAK03423.1 SPOR domain-containing protein [Methylobacter sp. YRD-M1]